MHRRLVAGLTAAALGVGFAGTGATETAVALEPAPVTLGSTTSPIPDVTGTSGSWSRTADGGYIAVAPSGQNAAATSEQMVAGTARYTAGIKVDAGSPYGVGALIFRATPDAAAGYAATIDPNLDRVRLFDLATGQDIVAPVAVPLDTGRTYTVDVHLDGARIHVAVDSVRRIDAADHRYQSGRVGLHAFNGTVAFGAPGVRTIDANVDGWEVNGGGWSATATGFRGAAPQDTNIRAIATGQSPTDVDFSTDIQVTSPYGVGTVLFRTNASGTAGHAVEVDPNAGRLRLYRVADNATLGTHATAIAVGKVYRLRVTAIGSRLAAYWQTDFLDPNGAMPAITATDSASGSGHVGLGAYNGTVVFQSMTLRGLEGALQGWRTASGSWEPDPKGLRAFAAAGTAARFIPEAASDVVASLDLTVTSPATASVVVRSGADGAGGLELRIDPGGGSAALYDRAGAELLLSGALPDTSFKAGQANRVQFTARGAEAAVLINGTPVLNGAVPAAAGSGVALLATGTAWFQNVRADSVDQYMNGLYQPGYHYSQNSGNSSDPNGLVFFDGEYHLFHQDRGRWAHAVSTDLLHWKQLPIALPHTAVGESWSGSAVVDATDASGLFGGGSGLIAYYTSFNHDAVNGNQSIHAAYSTDKGRTWRTVQAAPVVENPGGPGGGWDFRDPKVVWDGGTNKWVMVVAAGDHIRFFTSPDLIHWDFASSFGYGEWVRGGVWECPDFFELPVEGKPGAKRWVLWWSTGAVRSTNGSAAQYVTGTWNGTTFSADTGPAQVLQADHGRDYYAAMSFFGAPDNRRIMIGWMSNWDYAFSPPTGRWNGQLSIPREIKLVDVPGAGFRLTQAPVMEAESLRSSTWQDSNLTVTPASANALAGVSGRSFELEAEVGIPTSGGASSFTFGLRKGNGPMGGQETVVKYDAGAAALTVDRGSAGREDFTRYFAGSEADNSTAPWPSKLVGSERRVKVRILVDASSVEVFGGDGTSAVTSLIYPDPSATGLSFAADGGNARLVSVKVHQLSDTARLTGAPPSDVLPAAGGTARHNLGQFSVVPGGRWENTGAGLAGTFDKDSTALSASSYSNVRVQATVRFGTGAFGGELLNRDLMPEKGYGGAGSVLLRSTPDGSSAYYVNLDPNLRVVRVFKLVDGAFTVVASVPAALSHGVGYALDASVGGNRITVALDGTQLIEATDSSLSSGRVGVNVFDGRAAYQDVVVTPLP
ncbi:levanase [Pseudarthrobacter phenanthrenivorans]|uniref:Beta-fructosidase, levanase/invertase n=1 Tax=Pseudarthrobacter phenanthrenivorans (strain DSM 18606 / JCM 16027 / LMG 23796 / Sphe3) TaxID=930171 RepID=F0M123_PSEPM|nr:GH32 C-terminal domain-containing protein [Pseudarthrobacter phenanthrenivorans]ADX71906.1 beta-fructosidase, levanase/invertase [Pseudarthrobacter phenanthrenivorans Sphe3]TPV50115.1 levanase [Pseudarthrobacter phenanthrenivorans]